MRLGACDYIFHSNTDTTMAKVKEKAKTVVDIAMGDENFSTLVKALQAAGLVDTLKGDGPFTIFAPTNKAFDRLPDTDREDLFKSANTSRLTRILKHHVVSGRRMAQDIKKRSSISPMKGGSLRVETEGPRVKVGGATLQSTDLEAENGVVHAINRVLVPQRPSVAPVRSARSGACAGGGRHL